MTQFDTSGMTIRTLPAAEPRVESGPTCFGDDWPGVFIRGDDAFGFLISLDKVLDGSADMFARAVVRGLRDTLAECISSDELRGKFKE